MNKKDKDKFTVLSIRITTKENEMIKGLRENYFVNVSSYVRKCLKNLDNKLKNEK